MLDERLYARSCSRRAMDSRLGDCVDWFDWHRWSSGLCCESIACFRRLDILGFLRQMFGIHYHRAIYTVGFPFFTFASKLWIFGTKSMMLFSYFIFSQLVQIFARIISKACRCIAIACQLRIFNYSTMTWGTRKPGTEIFFTFLTMFSSSLNFLIWESIG